MTGLGCTRQMQSSHAAAKIDIAFDDPNLIADAGLVVALAERVGLPGLVTDRVKITGAANSGGANAGREGDVVAGRDGRRRGQHRRYRPVAAGGDGGGLRWGAGAVHA